MATETYAKLVRDRIPEIIAASGRTYRVAELGPEEFETALRAKLVEEAQEIQWANADHLLLELADLLEVVHELLLVHQISYEQVGLARQQRRAQRGGFDHRIQLLWAEKP